MAVTERNNLIVVGAGASREFGLPTGDGLKEEVSMLGQFSHSNATIKTQDQFLREVFQYEGRGGKFKSQSTFPSLAYAADFIARNMANAPSIDNFLHTHRNDLAVIRAGKHLISRAILKA